LAPRLDDTSPFATGIEWAPLIFDGNLGLGTMRPWTLTFDLAQGRAWLRTN
jgi:hypothetical protein